MYAVAAVIVPAGGSTAYRQATYTVTSAARSITTRPRKTATVTVEFNVVGALDERRGLQLDNTTPAFGDVVELSRRP